MKQTGVVLTIAAMVGAALAQTTVGAADERLSFPPSHREFLGSGTYRAGFGFDSQVVEHEIHSPDTGIGRPPRVGPNIRVNDPSGFPFGRSETTIAVGGNGNRVVVGWNDGEGFCGLPAGFCGPLGPLRFHRLWVLH